MNYEYSQTDFSRGILSGLFAGLVACVANTVFVLLYRSFTEFYEFNGLDVTVIVFGSICQLIVCGWLFYLFVHYMRKGVAFTLKPKFAAIRQYKRFLQSPASSLSSSFHSPSFCSQRSASRRFSQLSLVSGFTRCS